MNKKLILIAITALIIFPLSHAAAEVKPCGNCALERLVMPSANPVLNEAMDYDYSIFEMIRPDLAPKAIKNLSYDELMKVENVLAGGAHLAGGEVVATYEAGGKTIEIKYSDLEKFLLSLPHVQQNTESVKLISQKDKYAYLVNIIKTNLLYEEGIRIKDKILNGVIHDEAEYNRSNIFAQSINELMASIAEEYYKNSSSDNAPPSIDFRAIAFNTVSKQIDLKVETDNVLILKNIDNIALYTGETSLTLCTIKDDKVTVAEVKSKLSQYLNGSVSYKLFSDEEFLKFIIYEIIFEPAYVKHLVKSNVQFSFKPFGEYYVYAVAEAFLNHFLKNVSITPQECELYFKDNQDKFTIKESVLINYYIFSEGQKSFFEKAVKGALDPLKLSAAIKEGSIECSINENERFYKGQMANELQNYLFSIKPGSYSRIIDINTSGAIKYILFYVKSLDSEKPSTYSEIEKFVYRQALADKKAQEAVKLFDELFKKYKVKINLK